MQSNLLSIFAVGFLHRRGQSRFGGGDFDSEGAGRAEGTAVFTESAQVGFDLQAGGKKLQGPADTDRYTPSALSAKLDIKK
jgi:hypothetical protein